MSLEDRFQQLEPRERLILVALAGVVVLFVLVIIPATLYRSVGEQADENRRVRDAIELVERAEPVIKRRQAELEVTKAKYENPAPPLAGFLSAQANAAGIEIPESQDLAALPHAGDYEERRTKITLRQVGLLGLGKFMEGVENAGHPVSIGRLDIRKLGNKPDTYNVEMIVSAFDRNVDDAPEAPTDDGAP
jgi:general secretion pathway protein M